MNSKGTPHVYVCPPVTYRLSDYDDDHVPDCWPRAISDTAVGCVSNVVRLIEQGPDTDDRAELRRQFP